LCNIHSKVEQKYNHLAFKWDSFQKHVGCKKTKKVLKGVKKRDWYISKDYKHAKNEVVYACKGK
jgi:hypothetical protein